MVTNYRVHLSTATFFSHESVTLTDHDIDYLVAVDTRVTLIRSRVVSFKTMGTGQVIFEEGSSQVKELFPLKNPASAQESQKNCGTVFQDDRGGTALVIGNIQVQFPPGVTVKRFGAVVEGL